VFGRGILYFDDYNYSFINKQVLPTTEELKDMQEFENKSSNSDSSEEEEEEPDYSLNEVDNILRA